MKPLLIAICLVALAALALGVFPLRQALPVADLRYVATLGKPGPHNDRQRLPALAMDLVFESERRRILARQDNGAIVSWDLDSGGSRVVARTDSLFGYCRLAALLLVNDAEGVTQFDLAQDEVQPLATGTYDHASWDAACDRLALAGEESREIEIRDRRTPADVVRVATALPVRNGLALSGDGRSLAAAGGTYDAAEGHRTALELFALSDDATPSRSAVLNDPDTVLGLWRMAFAPDGQNLLVGAQVAASSGLRSIASDGGEIVWAQDGFASYWVRALAISPDGTLLATGDEKGLLRLWDLKSGKKRFERKSGLVIQALSFAEDGTRLAVALWDGTIGIVAVPSFES